MLKKTVRPEFLNRIDEIIMFTPLNQEEVTQIVRLQIDALSDMLKDKSIKLSATEDAITLVTLKYPDENGVTQSKTGQLSGGSALFSNLGMYAAKGVDSWLEVYVDVAPDEDREIISGRTFRLGIRDTGNTISTFTAVRLGDLHGTVLRT